MEEEKYTECYRRPLNGFTLPSSNNKLIINLNVGADGLLMSIKSFIHGDVSEIMVCNRSFANVLRKGYSYTLRYNITEKLTQEQLDRYFLPPTSINKRTNFGLKSGYKLFLNNEREICIHRKKDHMQLSDTDHTGLYFDTPILAITPEEVTY